MTQFKSALYLCLDQGGHESRAFIFNNQAEIMAEAHESITPLHSVGNHVEYDADRLINSVYSVTHHAIDSLGKESKHIVAAGLASQRSTIACWDKHNGKALAPIISWQDRRTEFDLVPYMSYADQIHQLSGLFLSPHYGASKIRWCLDNVDEVKSAYQKNSLITGPMASYLLCKLLKENPLVADPSNASRTLLYDINKKDWSKSLLDIFGIDRGILPTCVDSDYHFGTLNTTHVFDSLKHPIPLRMMVGDQSASLYAYGDPQKDTLYLTIGTGAFIQAINGSQLYKSSDLLNSMVIIKNSIPVYAFEGTINGAGSALSYIADKYKYYDYIKQLPSWLKKIDQPPLFFNGVSGLGTPYLISSFPSQYSGTGDIPELFVAVIESIIFLIQNNIEEIELNTSKPKKILVGGGLARLDGLCQRLADISKLTVIRSPHHETTSRGLAYLLSSAVYGDTDKTRINWAIGNKTDKFYPIENKKFCDRYILWKNEMKKIIATISA